MIARQHLQNFTQYLESLNIQIAYLSGSQNTQERREQISLIESGKAKVVIGTHALFQDSVNFKDLSLVIIDEQHKFGVHQLIIAHTILGIPFVVITVTASLAGFDNNLLRAGATLGGSPLRNFLKIQAPLIAPGVISGALFAFITSFDEVVIVLFVGGPEQYTLPRQMWSGIRNEISPTILAAATILVIFSILLLTTLEMLRRRAEKIRGITPH